MTTAKVSTQMSESMTLAVFLTLAGGFQDAYSYNCRGKVFANAQTGNIVLLGQNLAQGNWDLVLRYLLPLAAFLAGVYITEWVHHLYKDYTRIHWRQIVLVIEILLLMVVGFLPQSLNGLANMMMSFACAMQVNSFRKFRGIPCATTMCIGNMRSATEMLCKYHITRDKNLLRKSRHYYLVILIFAAGAAAGALLSIQLGERSIWLAALLLMAGFVLMFIKEDIRKESNSETSRTEP
ncbi:YoaK family protein [Diplocloster agilis]|uniref:DUF1275 domain-containing protein n=2 Tax=Diplocloster agilis TaxID=2850323 RepID=A0A949NB24_9FIRM|nr:MULTISPECIES: YoaK family protein [Lachnospiraceae]MBU9737117.1 DUF1275 domain-containing protein [Diplocloster agilis]MBU9744323.1 DUF1275 domain-containing protein [Diplocloster agilis]MCU6733533.1 DUF1275 domain-containing protein [Suonthocola fibrivorans]SCI96084.1 Predicted membrane protein [uncultured Clostridium sp.]